MPRGARSGQNGVSAKDLAALVDKAQALVLAMQKAGKGDGPLTRKFYEKALDAREKEGPDVTINPAEQMTVFRLLGMAEGSFRGYFTRKNDKGLPKSLVPFRAIPEAWQTLGIDDAIADHVDTTNVSSFRDFFDKAIEAVERIENGAQPHPARESPRQKPFSRIVPRPHLRDAIITRLGEVGCVAIVGMSGTGKTVLAREVMDHLRGTKAEEYPLSGCICIGPVVPRAEMKSGLANRRESTVAHYAVIFAEILAHIATAIPERTNILTASELQTEILKFTENWGQRINGKISSRDQLTPELQFFDYMNGKTVTYKVIASAAKEYAAGIRDVELLIQLAEIMRLAAANVIVCIDDAWDFNRVHRLANALFKGSGGDSRTPRLLLTTQQHRLLEVIEAPHNDFDIDRKSKAMSSSNQLDFGLSVIAAAAVPQPTENDGHDVADVIAAFGREHFSGSPPVLKAVAHIVHQLEAHPLALAILGGAWDPSKDSAEQYWPAIVAKLEGSDPDAFQAGSKNFTIQSDYRDILQAMQFGWEMMREDMRQRYLDLVIVDHDAVAHASLFEAFWYEIPRARKSLTRGLLASDHPLAVFASRSLLQVAEDGSYRLHDLHQRLIQSLLETEQGVAARHHDLLRAVGLVDDQGGFALDDDRHFHRQMSGRLLLLGTQLHPSEKTEVASVAKYLAQNLLRHLLEVGKDEALDECINSPAFLEAYVHSFAATHKDSKYSWPAINVEAIFQDIRRPYHLRLHVLFEQVSFPWLTGPKICTEWNSQLQSRLNSDRDRNHLLKSRLKDLCKIRLHYPEYFPEAHGDLLPRHVLHSKGFPAFGQSHSAVPIYNLDGTASVLFLFPGEIILYDLEANKSVWVFETNKSCIPFPSNTNNITRLFISSEDCTILEINLLNGFPKPEPVISISDSGDIVAFLSLETTMRGQLYFIVSRAHNRIEFNSPSLFVISVFSQETKQKLFEHVTLQPIDLYEPSYRCIGGKIRYVELTGYKKTYLNIDAFNRYEKFEDAFLVLDLKKLKVTDTRPWYFFDNMLTTIFTFRDVFWRLFEYRVDAERLYYVHPQTGKIQHLDLPPGLDSIIDSDISIVEFFPGKDGLMTVLVDAPSKIVDARYIFPDTPSKVAGASHVTVLQPGGKSTKVATLPGDRITFTTLIIYDSHNTSYLIITNASREAFILPWHDGSSDKINPLGNYATHIDVINFGGKPHLLVLGSRYLRIIEIDRSTELHKICVSNVFILVLRFEHFLEPHIIDISMDTPFYSVIYVSEDFCDKICIPVASDLYGLPYFYCVTIRGIEAYCVFAKSRIIFVRRTDLAKIASRSVRKSEIIVDAALFESCSTVLIITNKSALCFDLNTLVLISSHHLEELGSSLCKRTYFNLNKIVLSDCADSIYIYNCRCIVHIDIKLHRKTVYNLVPGEKYFSKNDLWLKTRSILFNAVDGDKHGLFYINPCYLYLFLHDQSEPVYCKYLGPNDGVCVTERGTRIALWSDYDISVADLTGGFRHLNLLQHPRLMHHDGFIIHCAWLNNSILASWAKDRTLRVWQAVSGKEIDRFTFDSEISYAVLAGHTDDYHRIAILLRSGRYMVIEISRHYASDLTVKERRYNRGFLRVS